MLVRRLFFKKEEKQLKKALKTQQLIQCLPHVSICSFGYP